MIEPRFTTKWNYQTKLKVPDQPWLIYGNPTNFNHFVKTPLVPYTPGDREYQGGEKKAHTRRKYKGDPTPSAVGLHGYSYVHDPGRKIGNAIPGWSFILDDGTEKRQFTTTADVVTLIAFLEDEVKAETRLYTQGARYDLAAPSEGQYVAASS